MKRNSIFAIGAWCNGAWEVSEIASRPRPRLADWLQEAGNKSKRGKCAIIASSSSSSYFRLNTQQSKLEGVNCSSIHSIHCLFTLFFFTTTLSLVLPLSFLYFVSKSYDSPGWNNSLFSYRESSGDQIDIKLSILSYCSVGMWLRYE